MSLREVVKYFDDYDQRYRLPVRCGVEVQGVEKRESVFQVRTTDRDYEAKNVVIATGLYQSPKIPAFAAGIPADILQLHSMQYRNPSVLPHGAVLVIGTGQSGAQIAEELYQSEGRSISRSAAQAACPVDIAERTSVTGSRASECLTPKYKPEVPSGKFHPHPQISGKNGGESLNLHQFSRDGVMLLGHLRDAREGRLIIART